MEKRWALWIFIGVSITTLTLLPVGYAAEHGGQEHGGTSVQEHGGTAVIPPPPAPAVIEPTPEAIRSSIQGFIDAAVQANGSYSILDPVTDNIRNLELVQVHERVGKTGDYYYSCTDMTDVNSGEILDLDFDVANDNGVLMVLADKVRIHKVNNQPRYTYDDKDNMIPVTGQIEPTQEF